MWEYKVQYVGDDTTANKERATDAEVELNKLGIDGWELIQILNYLAYFKRPKYD